MLDRIFHRFLRYGPRLLLAMVLPAVAICIGQVVHVWASSGYGQKQSPALFLRFVQSLNVGVEWERLPLVLGHAAEAAAYFLFAALFVHRLDVWRQSISSADRDDV